MKRQSKDRASIKRLHLPNFNLVHAGMILSVITILLAGIMILQFNSKSDTTNTYRDHPVGQPVSIPKTFDVTVLSSREDTDLAKVMRLPDSSSVRIIEVKITNRSAIDMNFLPSIHTYLRDEQGTNYTIMADISQPALPPGQIKPNQSIQGNLAYVTSSQNIPLWFYFDTHFESTSPIVYKIR